MKYSTFEILALVFGGAAILGTVVAAAVGGSGYPEVVAQLMLFPVLIAALHSGRNGGFLAALFAVALYVGLRVPDLAREGLEGPLASLLVARAAAYVVVGVIGGEVCSRIKYLFCALEDRQLIDRETGVYSAKHVGALLRRLMEEHRRYGHTFSAALFTLDAARSSDALKRGGRRSIARELAATLRDEVRAVDEVGRVSEHGFLLLLPNTSREGGSAASRRLEKSLEALLSRLGFGGQQPPLQVKAMSFPDDAEPIAELVERLTGEPVVPGEPHPRRRVESPTEA